MFNKLLGYTLASASIREFRTEQGHKTRGTINLWVNSPYGTGKSSIMNSIVRQGLGVIIQDYSTPGLIGTIKRDGIAVIGSIRHLPNTTAILEEFQNTTKDQRAVMLSLMEDQRYSRTLGFEILKPEHIIEDGFGFVAEGTSLEIHLRASFVVLSMTYQTPTALDRALLSRCVPVFLDTSVTEQTDLFIKGKELDINTSEIKRAREELKGTSVIIPEKTRETIAKKYQTAKIRPENLTRAMWDFARVAYIEAFVSGANEITKEIIDNIDWLVRVQELGYAKRTLTKTAYDIYLYLAREQREMTTTEISEALGLSREYTARLLTTLVKKNLLHRATVSKNIVYWVD